MEFAIKEINITEFDITKILAKVSQGIWLHRVLAQLMEIQLS